MLSVIIPTCNRNDLLSQCLIIECLIIAAYSYKLVDFYGE